MFLTFEYVLTLVYKDFEGERYCICYAGIVQKSIGFSS